MKKQLFLLLVTGMVAAAGCNDGTTGGPGVSNSTPGNVNTTNRPTYGEADNTFTLDVPALSTSIKQGETDSITIGIDRGDNFEQDVTLNLTGLPQGVTMDPASPKILKSDKEVTIKFIAADDAAVGDFTVSVVGNPTQGADATSELKLTIAENE